ncbi:hypothetical protein [Nocardia mexicana]|uniref:Restriction endonuclease BglII n=1 Tax=Nocardia mexicana TaxID=279262 RepID=A0A370GRL4_9NOCA|nr:hypothetical protein [Nocardia mexicana]RDI46151.1 restriction endonuclease BglII [Nocardia mexicana]
MEFEIADFAGASEFFEGEGSGEWAEIHAVLDKCSLQLQPSDQAGKGHRPIFDPKATNRELTDAAALHGWKSIPVPKELQMFGSDWDVGKQTTLVEWQFSNYPFLWNNIIRTQGVYRSKIQLSGMSGVEAMIIVTKSGKLPASNSTLYYEQARAQIKTVMDFLEFTLPIRLVGITLDSLARSVEAVWNTYANNRYDRVPRSKVLRTFDVTWSSRPAKHGNLVASLE